MASRDRSKAAQDSAAKARETREANAAERAIDDAANRLREAIDRAKREQGK